MGGFRGSGPAFCGNRWGGGASKCVMEAAVRRVEASVGGEDWELVREVQAGRGEAFAPLVRRYQDRVFNACYRMCRRPEDAEDLTQEVFLRAFAKIGSFAGASGFYTWLFRIAVNVSLTHRRRSRLRLVPSIDDGEAGVAGERVVDDRAERPDEAMVRREREERVVAAMGELEDEQRVILVLRDVEGFEYARIGEVLAIPVGTVKSRVHRARAALREVFDRMAAGAVRGGEKP